MQIQQNISYWVMTTRMCTQSNTAFKRVSHLASNAFETDQQCASSGERVPRGGEVEVTELQASIDGYTMFSSARCVM